MIKQQLTQKQQQKLSPQQIQQVKLLELTSLEIENRINQELEENPALEEVQDGSTESDADNSMDEYNLNDESANEDLSLGDYRTEDDIPDYKLQQVYYHNEKPREEIPYSESESFHEFLLDQLYLKNLSEEKLEIGEYIIGNIDQDGYIRRDPDALVDDLAFQYGWDVPISEMKESIKVIQDLDPPGVGAASLQECLLLQLKRKEKSHDRKIAIAILRRYFDAFTRKKYEKIMRGLNISEEKLKQAIQEIIILNPRPGNAWETNMETKMAHITPDFIIETINGELFFSMSDQNVPDLRVSKEYGDLLVDFSAGAKQNAEKKEALLFVKQKLDSAKWFIDALKQRHITLKKTMLTIVEIQRDFFLTGEEINLKPMILKDVAELCGFDISTVSRVINSKYVQTNWGVYLLKFFFSEAMVNQEGEEVSTRKIKTILRECIEAEDKDNPCTDERLVKVLKSKGYDLARRTVAKYRKQMNIPIAKLRKEL
jgi:RNA polymerase sigma-54 factor